MFVDSHLCMLHCNRYIAFQIHQAIREIEEKVQTMYVGGAQLGALSILFRLFSLPWCKKKLFLIFYVYNLFSPGVSAK